MTCSGKYMPSASATRASSSRVKPFTNLYVGQVRVALRGSGRRLTAQRRVGEHHRGSAALDVARDEFVGIRAHHLDNLVLERLVDRLTILEGKWVVGAPPMELLAPFAPVGTLPLAQRIGRWPFFVAAALEAQWQLPADPGLPVHRALAGF